MTKHSLFSSKQAKALVEAQEVVVELFADAVLERIDHALAPPDLPEELVKAIGPHLEGLADELTAKLESRLTYIEEKLEREAGFAEIAKEFGPRLTGLEDRQRELLEAQQEMSARLQALDISPIIQSIRELERRLDGLGDDVFYERAEPVVKAVADTIDRLGELRAHGVQGQLADHFELIDSKLRRALKAIGVEPVEVSPGEAFDAAWMDVVERRPVSTPERAELVLDVVQLGYTYQSVLRRPAGVVVGAYDKGGRSDGSSDSSRG